MKHNINEKKLTAYVLNELNKKERIKIEKAIFNSEELRLEVEMLKEFCSIITSDLQDEPLPALTDFQRNSLEEQLVVEPVKKRFNIRSIFEWKIMVPTICIPVLAVVLFLKVPQQMFNNNDATNQEQLSNNSESFVSNASNVTIPVGINRIATNQAYITSDRRVTNSVTSNYLNKKTENNNYGKGYFFDDLFLNRNHQKLYNSNLLAIKKAKPRFATSQYNLTNYDIVFRDRLVSKPDNTLQSLPLNINTTGYDTVREFLNNNHMPPKESVKSEEMINYFDYNYASQGGDIPFTVITEISEAPWNNKHKLMHIGVKGKKAQLQNSTDSNLYNGQPIIANDIKIRLEFDPQQIKAYRLVGYENGNRNRNGVHHDSEIFIKELLSGHIATVLYELMPANLVETGKTANDTQYHNETKRLMTLKLGYKLPDKDRWHVVMYPVAERYIPIDQSSDSFRFSAAVAGFGMLLKDSKHNKDLTYNDVIEIANSSIGKDTNGLRSEFIKLVKTASDLDIRH